MNSMCKKLFILVGIIIMGRGAGAQEQIDSLRERLQKAGAKIEQLENERRELREAAKVLADEISSLKAAQKAEGDSGKVFKNPTLIYDLRESVKLAKVLDEFEIQISRLREEIKNICKELDSYMGREISKAVEKWKREQQKERKTSWLRKIAELRRGRNYYRNLLGMITTREREFKIEALKIEPFDGPQDLREKADIIEDHMDRLEKRCELLKREIEELKGEKELYAEINDFLREKFLFHEDEKVIKITRDLGTKESEAPGEKTPEIPEHGPAGGQESEPSYAGEDENGVLEGAVPPSGDLDTNIDEPGWSNAPETGNNRGAFPEESENMMESYYSFTGKKFDILEGETDIDTYISHLENLYKESLVKMKRFKKKAEKMRLRAGEIEQMKR